MTTSISETNSTTLYACPACKVSLEPVAGNIHCKACNTAYPIVDDIPDFLVEDRERSLCPYLRWTVAAIARLYETPLWYVPILKMAGGKGAPSYRDVKRLMVGMMPSRQGLLLDVACGSGTWGRRLASRISSRMCMEGSSSSRLAKDKLM